MDFARQQISLDGTWQFAADDDHVGIAQRWYETSRAFSEHITVPGCWQAQAIYCHTGWYQRSVVVPEDWRGQRVSLKFDGVSYTTDVWVNGQHVTHNEGLMLPFQADVSAFVRYGDENTIVVRVQQYDYPNVFQTEQLGDQIVGVYGCWITWGGIFQSVTLEATAPTWIDHIFCVPDIDHDRARVRVQLGGEARSGLQLLAWVGDADEMLAVSSEAEIVLNLPHAVLWHPDQPFLYTVQLSLLHEGQIIDAASTRFGMRQIETRGQQILLNHEPIFLRGWLDDAIYPEQISPTITLEQAREILRQCKAYGFNFVRHHTHIPVKVFHEAADEIGVMQLQEFGSFASIGNPRIDASQKTRRQIDETWRGMIRRDCNHPSIIAYGMNNECWNDYEFAAWAPIYRDLYRLGKALDPTRLIIDNSGGEDHWSVASDLFDKHIYQFPTDQEMRRATAGRPYRAYIPKREAYFNVDLSQVNKPCLVTEVGGWCTFPDFGKIRAATGGEIPWWLSRDMIRNPRMGHALVNRMEAEMPRDLYPQIVANSERWAGEMNKLQIEHMRQTPGIAGYAYCTFTDCYNWGSGLLDNYYQPKSYADLFASVNQASVLLWPRERWCFQAGEQIEAAFALSHYGREPIEHGCLHWSLLQGDHVLAEGARDGVAVGCFGVYDFTPFTVTIPELPQAARLTLRLTLTDAAHKLTNEWSVWVFPPPALNTQEQIVFEGADADFQRWQARFPSIEQAAPNPAMWITTRMTEAVLDYLEAGGRVLWLQQADSLSCRPYHQHPAVDYHATIINDHPALADFPHEGWCDMQFHHLTGTAVLDTGYFDADKFSAIIEAFHAPYWLQNPRILPFRRKGFLAEARVGQGYLLTTSFVFDTLGSHPEVDAMAVSLVRYLLGSPQAAHTLTTDDVREWAWGSVHGAAVTDFVPFLM